MVTKLEIDCVTVVIELFLSGEGDYACCEGVIESFDGCLQWFYLESKWGGQE